MEYACTRSFPQLMTSPHFIGPSPPPKSTELTSATLGQFFSVTGVQSPLPSLHAFNNLIIPTSLASHLDLTSYPQNPESFLSIPSTYPNEEPMRLDETTAFANASTNSLNTTSVDASLANNSLQHYVNPLDITLQPGPLVPFYNFPNVYNDSPHLDGNYSNTSSIAHDSETPPFANTLANCLNTTFASTANDSLQHNVNPIDITLQPSTESGCNEPDSVRPAGKNRNENRHRGRHSTHNESNTSSDTTESGSDESDSTDSDSDKMDDSSSPSNTLNKCCRPSSPVTSKRLGSNAMNDSSSGPTTSNKHCRSSSVPSNRLGSKENPIDVDIVVSLFEPIVIQEYVRTFIFQPAYTENTLQVKKEMISLPLETNPPIMGNRLYTVFDVTGKPESITPSFHVSR
jgi:hypothetical protein